VPSVDKLAAIRAALEAAGVEFTNGGQPGVRMRRARDANCAAKTGRDV
jgi:hypothetical protein